jgi:5-deoxy-glucuronate isomerase
MQHKLPSSPGPGTEVQIDPSGAGWKYLSFRVHAVVENEQIDGETGEEEAVVVVLGGNGRLSSGPSSVDIRDGRADVFSGLPYYAYVPRRSTWSFRAYGPARVAIGYAPCEQDHPVRVCTPADVKVEMRGGHNVTRQISHLIDPGFGCQRLLCVEVYTPSGNWSSYPPHKHDEENPPHEVKLEEVYYYQMAPDGFAIQRLYDGNGFDEMVLARDGDLVLVRRGYHPVVAGPGYDIYYLNVLAGDNPSWAASDDPNLAWVRQTWNSREPVSLPLGSPVRNR